MTLCTSLAGLRISDEAPTIKPSHGPPHNHRGFGVVIYTSQSGKAYSVSLFAHGPGFKLRPPSRSASHRWLSTSSFAPLGLCLSGWAFAHGLGFKAEATFAIFLNQGVTLTITMGAMHSTRCGYGLCQKCFIPVRENGYLRCVVNSPSNELRKCRLPVLLRRRRVPRRPLPGRGAGCPTSRAGGSYPMARAPPRHDLALLTV